MIGLFLLGCLLEESTNKTKYFPISIEGVELQAELALTEKQRAKGLMYRDELPKDHGMLFLFDTPNRYGFWMRSVEIPLDLGFFDSDGYLLEVRKLFPHDEGLVYSAGNRVLIAVEVNRGWYEANGIDIGAQIDMATLKSALKNNSD